MTFFYFTAFTAQFADLGGFVTEEYAHRYAAQIVAGVSVQYLPYCGTFRKQSQKPFNNKQSF